MYRELRKRGVCVGFLQRVHQCSRGRPPGLSRVGFFGRGVSRRGGSGWGAGWGPLWPPVGGADLFAETPSEEKGTRAPTRGPTPHRCAPAPTRTPTACVLSAKKTFP